MSSRFKFNTLPKLQEGETVLLFLPWIWAMSSLSAPSYRLFASIPPLFEGGLYITQRRILLEVSLFRLVNHEVSLWCSGWCEPDDDEIQFTSVGEHGYLGSYLEVISSTAREHWFRSRNLRVRLYTRHAHHAQAILTQLLASREFVEEEDFEHAGLSRSRMANARS